MRKRIVILASGSGSNAEKIIAFFRESSIAEVVGVISNKADAGVHARAAQLGIPSMTWTNETLKSGKTQVVELQKFNADLVILAGYLKLIPTEMVEAFPERIVNIHPALLPKFGGKGMYGMNVHEAVYQAKETVSGPTIHIVSPEYDKGRILFQASTPLDVSDSPAEIAKKVLALEHRFFPRVIADYILTLNDTLHA